MAFDDDLDRGWHWHVDSGTTPDSDDDVAVDPNDLFWCSRCGDSKRADLMAFSDLCVACAPKPHTEDTREWDDNGKPGDA